MNKKSVIEDMIKRIHDELDKSDERLSSAEKERVGSFRELKSELEKLSTEVQDIKTSKIYQNAFEWRFEFPEVMDAEGEFVGFDVVIGNPPYIDSEAMVNKGLEAERKFIVDNYLTAKGIRII